jgi:neutral amino acid transport system permease protein
MSLSGRGVRLLRWISGFVAFLALFSFGASGASADDGYQIRVQVKEQSRDESGKTDNQPVAGVIIVVTDASGVEVGRSETDAEGVAVIAIPAKDDYTVTLDESSLPDGQSLSEQTAAVQQVTKDSFITSTKVINFFTGESQGGSQSFVEKISQRTVNGIRLGLVLAMCSVGLSLIFGTTGLTNFAHGEMVTFGGLVGYLLNVTGMSFLGFLAFLPGVHSDGSFHILLAAPLAIALGGLFGWALNAGIFLRLRKRGIGLVTQMVLTVGLSILLRNFYLSRFDSRTRPFKEFSLQKAWEFGPISITPRDFTVSVLSLLILVAVALSLRYTRLGKATRAVSDNPDLASATGIDSERVVRLVWILGGALAAAGGIFRGLDEQVSFDMGGRLLFLLFAGITLGGLGSAFGALVGGFVVGVLVEVASMVVPTELKTTPALLILILVLLFRPQGILGRAQRVG